MYTSKYNGPQINPTLVPVQDRHACNYCHTSDGTRGLVLHSKINILTSRQLGSNHKRMHIYTSIYRIHTGFQTQKDIPPHSSTTSTHTHKIYHLAEIHQSLVSSIKKDKISNFVCLFTLIPTSHTS